MDSFQILMFASSVLLSIQHIPQNYKIYKNKRAKDISYISLMITLSGISGIITYGVHMDLVEMWAPPILQVALTSQSLLMKIYYDNFYKQSKIFVSDEISREISEEIDNAVRNRVIINIGQKAASEHLEEAIKFN